MAFLSKYQCFEFLGQEKMKSIKKGFAKFDIYSALLSTPYQFNAWLDKGYILFLTPGSC